MKNKKVSVFDFDGTLICLKDRLYDMFHDEDGNYDDEIKMLNKHFKEEDFVSDSAMEKYYVSPRTLCPDHWDYLHDEGPVLDKAREQSKDPDYLVYILTGRHDEKDMVDAMGKLLDHLGVDVPRSKIKAVGYDNAAEDKAKFLSELVEQNPETEIDFYDDREDYIEAASEVDGVNATKV